jgi:molybdopterin synthase sulfur carrier subunit
MAEVIFTENLKRHVDCPQMQVDGTTVREVLNQIFAENVRLRSYVLDEQQSLRKHMGIIVDGIVVRDREKLSDPVGPDSRVFVLQALSGG